MSEKTNKDWKKFKEDNAIQDELDHVDDTAESEGLGVSGNALDHPSYPDLEEKLTLAEQKAHENWEQSMRVMAELDNVRRRAERDIANAHRYGLEKLLNSLLPIADSLEQALQLADKHADTAMYEGLDLTMKLFLGVLEKHDVHQLDPQGEMFDPQQHEAMTTQASADVADNTVIAVFQKGYMLNDRVIRPARVIVAKNP